MKRELEDHGGREAQVWLGNKIESGEIVCYSDDKILSEMGRYIQNSCFSYYRSFLKQGCDIFSAEFYSQYFLPLDEMIDIPFHTIKKLMQMTGKARRWDMIPTGCEKFGNLLENLTINTEREALPKSRLESDWKELDRIKELYGVK